MSFWASFKDHINPLALCFFIISAIAGILLKPQDVYFFFSKILRMILNNSDIVFGSDYDREN